MIKIKKGRLLKSNYSSIFWENRHLPRYYFNKNEDAFYFKRNELFLFLSGASSTRYNLYSIEKQHIVFIRKSIDCNLNEMFELI